MNTDEKGMNADQGIATQSEASVFIRALSVFIIFRPCGAGRRRGLLRFKTTAL
jgi:hypothetical protein